MFEEIVEKKYRPLKTIADEIKNLSIDTIKNSDLPVYAINFLIAEQIEITDNNVLDSMLEKSVKLIVNYSLRPRWTIINYLFGGFDSKPSDEILRKVEVFHFYRYYVDLIKNHIKDDSLLFITQDEVNFLINEANKVVLEKLVNDTSSIKIKNFFSQVYKLKYGDDKEINLDWSIPFLFIKLFLEDKDFPELLEKFNIIPGLDDTMEIEMKTAIKVLLGKYYVNDDFFVLKDAPTIPKTESPKIEIKETNPEENEVKKIKEEIPVKVNGVHAVSELPDVKIKKVEEIKTPDNPEDRKEESKTPIEEKSKPQEEEKLRGIIRIIKNIPIKKFHREKKVPEEEKPIEEIKEPVEEKNKIPHRSRRINGEEKIKHLFKGEELKAIQKKIFKDSKTETYKVFDELDNFDNWNDASEYLKEIFSKNRVSLYNKYTVLFIDILNDHFNKTEKGE